MGVLTPHPPTVVPDQERERPPAGPEASALEQIPDTLRAADRWVAWRREEVDGRATKVPIAAATGRRCDVTDPASWTTLDAAAAAAARRADCAGIGFVFADADDLAGVDLDDCIDGDGRLAAQAAEIVERFNTYTEVSPSGRGLKLFFRGVKPEWAGCRTSKVEGFGRVEVYDRARFFTVTGQWLEGSPGTVEHGQEALDWLCGKLFPREEPRPAPAPATAPVSLGDDALINAASAARNGEKFRRLWAGDTSEYGDDDSAADLALCSILAFWTRRDAARIDQLFQQSRLYRDKWERDDYRQRTIAKAIEGCREVYGGRNGVAPRRQHAMSDELPTVVLGPDEHRVADEVVEQLAADQEIYQRGTVLVRVARVQENGPAVRRARGSSTILILPKPNLRERITRRVELLRADAQGELVPAHPPAWLVAGIDARGDWPSLRHLTGLSDAPILRPDGSICQTPGYDEETGVLYEPSCSFPEIPAIVTVDDAKRAAQNLLAVVSDFRFEAAAHEAAWLAALLTPLARQAFGGPAPLFLLDANIRGAGKTLLAQTISRIVSGRDMPVTTYAHSTEEMRKLITAIAIAGDGMILLDNLAGRFGNDALDRALTSTRWKDRILGRSEQVDLPLNTVWMASGNNVTIGADTIRRIIHIRLDVLEERPEERQDFTHPDLRAWVLDCRPALLADALSILSGFLRAGSPNQGLIPFGSYEGWSDLVRQAVVWVGLPDPYETRGGLAEAADTEREALEQLMEAWRLYDPHAQGLALAPLIKDLYATDGTLAPPEAAMAMRSALEQVVGAQPGKAPTARAAGAKLKGFRRRVIAGRYFDHDPQKSAAGVVWRLMGGDRDSDS